MAKQQSSLRPAGFDDLGLRRVLGDRLLPLLVASMSFLAALALAGSVAAASLARHWAEGAAAALTVQIPRSALGDGSPESGSARDLRVLAVLQATPGIAAARLLSADELDELLRPWLGKSAVRLSLPLPSVIEVHLADAGPDLTALTERLRVVAPGTLVESHGIWVERLTLLARSLQACAWLALLLVVLVAAAVIMVATRAGLMARRETIELVHGLGATDGYIAGRFAARATRLAATGGIGGAVAALPVLVALAVLAQPFVAAAPTEQTSVLSALPVTLWIALPALPLVAGAIGFATAQVTVRRWLRRLP